MSRLHLIPCALLTLIVLALPACNDESDPAPEDFVKGRNLFQITDANLAGEYYVHVPEAYDGERPLPVVFMLHGTSGTGLDMWERSGWKEVGESDTVLTVFPSSRRYCIIDDPDGLKNTTKWNAQPASWVFCPDETPRNDFSFLTAVIGEVKARFNADEKRFYLVGFSNGGQMAALSTIELSDQFAAVVENAGSFYADTTYVPKRTLPTAFQIGNKDYGPGVDGPEIPLSRIDDVLADTTYKPGRSARTHIRSFGLSDQYTVTGDTNTVVIATFPSLDPGSPADYRFVFVKGLAHAYPNGTNHWMAAAPLHWAWLKQFTLP